MENIFKSVVNNPLRILNKAGNFPFMGNLFYQRYFIKAKEVGIKKLFLVLSFDCDTQRDIEVVSSMHDKLIDLKIRPVYCVPGEILIKEKDVFKNLLLKGAEFINHGYKIHSKYDENKRIYESTFFYDINEIEKIKNDIYDGHEAIKEVLGFSAKGFRIPHFGLIQDECSLKKIHLILSLCGYTFSTSTVPYYSFKYGPIFNNFGLKEIPLSGRWSNPFRVLDSYSFINKESIFDGNKYLIEGSKIANRFSKKISAGILNYYVDPSQINDNELFFKTIARWQQISYSVSYNSLLDELANLKL